MICRQWIAHGDWIFGLGGLLIGFACVMAVIGCDRIDDGESWTGDIRCHPSLSQLLKDTGIPMPIGSVLLRSEQQNSIVDAESYYKIKMDSREADSLRRVLRAYPIPSSQIELPPQGAFDWWKHNLHTERYVIDRPDGNSVCAIYEFVDDPTTTTLYVVIIPF